MKITRPNTCPIRLVRTIFEKVERLKLPCSRHLCRIVPLSKVFFANETEFETNMASLILEHFPHRIQDPINVIESEGDLQPQKKLKQEESGAIITETSDVPVDLSPSGQSDELEATSLKRSASEISYAKVAPLLPVSFLFKKRNHNTLNRLQTQQIVFNRLPRDRCRVDFKNPKVRKVSLPLLA